MHLKELRLEKGYTCKQMAEILHISEKTYRGYEKNCRKLKADKLLLLVNFFNISSGYILGLTDERKIH
ncbi:MAG: helix-turn-helix domain-containing protein [Bacteroides sp.]|nr:helix-turn-helix domain-containing protein [Bacillota bacterium]MCM1393302.1 helix-turn-helix domain-containing protein [[Eubacterium] siraeum]MCM1455728.1 helix-turn-helix domain-containing protein [Bacteroides sp.]